MTADARAALPPSGLELQAVTDAGRRMVELADLHAADFAGQAEGEGREEGYAAANMAALQESRFLAACVPPDFGGLGVASVHDLAVGVNHLARGDGSTALGANMHLAASWRAARTWTAAKAAGDTATSEALEPSLTALGAGQVLSSSAAAEPGTSPGYCRTRATPVEGGWRVSGRKTFATNSPAATAFSVFVAVEGDDGTEQLGVAQVLAGAEGLEVCDNWDALGMRASGSGDLVLKDCFVPEGMLSLMGPLGPTSSAMIQVTLFGVSGLVGAFLGVAEAAQALAIDHVTTRRAAPSGRLAAERPAVQHLVAESAIDLAAARAMLDRTLSAVDASFAVHEGEETPLDEAHRLMADFQCTKWFVNRKAVDIVDRALTLSGGAGYLTANPLSRLYRDVRAGPFMQSFSPLEAFEYIGKVTLGLDPALEQ
ncbi:MAG: acyl-CoA dehydrogenase [Actinomycetota bacterium]|nr:acyl-CoA dehydrogenase [Actinomycetota bacterium]